MKYGWNDVLAAFDREIPLLKALRDEYDAFVRESIDVAWTRLPPACSDVAEIDVSAEDGVMGATVKLRGDHGRARLEVQMWPAVEYGGPAGILRWVLVVPKDLGEGFPPLARIVAVARDASNTVATEVVQDAPADLDTLTDHAVLRWGSLPLGPDLAAQVARTLAPAISAMDSAAAAVLAQHVTTPRSWMEALLMAMRADGAFTSAGAIRAEQGGWGVGVTVNVRVSPTDYGWFTACNDGRLAFNWEPPKPEKEARRIAVMNALSSPTAFSSGGWHGVVLLDAAAVAQRQAAGDTASVRALILDTWRAYRAACIGGSA